MNIASIFGPLAFFSLYTSVQGHVWPLAGAEVGGDTYYNQVSLERWDGATWYIHAVPNNSIVNVPRIVHGPFKLRGFGPYCMLIVKIWLNTDGGEQYVTVTFHDATVAREFYHVLNPHHSPSFLSDFKVEELALYSLDGKRRKSFEEGMSKALDIFLLETETGDDSRVRSYVIHNTEGDQEPILIFHSLECEMTVNGNYLMLYISPQNSHETYRYSIKLENPSTAKLILDAYILLQTLGTNVNPRDLEALPRNTYPVQGIIHQGQPSSTRECQQREN